MDWINLPSDTSPFTLISTLQGSVDIYKLWESRGERVRFMSLSSPTSIVSVLSRYPEAERVNVCGPFSKTIKSEEFVFTFPSITIDTDGTSTFIRCQL